MSEYRKLTVYLPDQLAKQLRIACIEHETTICSVFSDLVEKYVSKPFPPKHRDRRKTRNVAKKGA
jgi:hypothetical protein